MLFGRTDAWCPLRNASSRRSSPARRGRARSRGDLDVAARDRARGDPPGRHRGHRRRRDRGDQPARDDGGVGPAHRGAGGARRSSGSAAHRAALRSAAADGRRPTDSGAHRAGPGRLLLRHQARRGCSSTFRACGPGPRRARSLFGTVDTFLIWRLTGGRRARHRRLQRLAARCCSTSAPATGTTSCLARWTCPARCCPRSRSSSELYGETRSGAFGAASRRGHRRRSAGGAVRAGLLSRRGRRRRPTAPAASCC